jgi:hypothetical protein
MDEIGQHSHWISDVHDVHDLDVHDVEDESGVIVSLSHYNNSDSIVQNLRAKIWFEHETDDGGELHVSLRSAAGEIRTETARIHFRPGATQRLAIESAYHVPKTLLQQMEVMSSLKNGTLEEDDPRDIELPVNTSSGEIALGDLAPQAAVTALVVVGEVPSDRPVLSKEPMAPAARTTLNGDAEYPFLQVANDRNTRAWRPQIAGFRPGSPIGFSMYFRNSGSVIARDVRVRLALKTDDSGIVARGEMTAANVERVGGEARVTFDRPTPTVRLYYDRSEVYRVSSDVGRLIDATNVVDGVPLGDLDPGEWGWFKVTYATSAVTREGSSQDCLIDAAIADERIERTISFENTTHVPIADVKLRIHLDYLPETVRSSISLTTNGKELVRRIAYAATAGKQVVLRYRDAQVFTSPIARHLDARKAAESDISLGDIPADRPIFVRLIYDVVKTPDPAHCSGSCRTCSNKEPCRF